LVFKARVQVVAVSETQPAVPTPQLHVTVVAGAVGAPPRVTDESRGNAAEHVPGQVIPEGELVTVPVPATTAVRAADVQAAVPTPAAETKADPVTKFPPS
jgi:hypothetical protein